MVEEEDEEEPAPVLLVGVPRVYSCGECRTHLASDMDVISRVGWWVGVWWWGWDDGLLVGVGGLGCE